MHQTITLLEWPSLLKQYSLLCRSTPGQQAALLIEPAKKQSTAEELLNETEEARRVLQLDALSFLGALPNCQTSLDRLAKDFVLDGPELLDLFKLMEVGAQVKSILERPSSLHQWPKLHTHSLLISAFGRLSERMRLLFETDGRLRDTASDDLKQLRDQERRLHNQAREKIEEILLQAHKEGWLQEKFFDFRDGRYLVPVRSDSKNKVPGLVVDASSTRATLFVEPASVRAINDQLRNTQTLIVEEEYRILRSICQELQPKCPELKNSLQACIKIDLAIGRGALADSFESVKGCSKPEFCDSFYLEQAYHPLLSYVLPPEKIVRNTFHLESEQRVLVISGPNTGGKTVLLKCLGLFSLMSRSGFYLSCAGKAQLPFFQQIMAQVGDAQNLELSLSSFSGSVVQLRDILLSADHETLVLIDEILHATDPDEAAALAQAVLEQLREQKSFAIVTTHLNGLKVSDSFAAASMEFDPDKLEPTYRLRIGVPGSSRAIEIAKRLGFSDPLLDRAKCLLSDDRKRAQLAVDQLEAQERQLAQVRATLVETEKSLAAENLRQKTLNEDLSALKKRFRSEATDAWRRAQQEALVQIEGLMAKYRKLLTTVDQKHSASMEAQRELQEVKSTLIRTEKTIDELAGKETEHETKQVQSKKDEGFKINCPVRVISLGTTGILVSDPTDRNKPAQVMIGNMRMKQLWENLTPLKTESMKARSRYSTSSDTVSVAPELMLVGKKVDQAESLLQTYLDQASRSGRPSVRIVHGIGTGALRKMVRETLKQSSYDIKFRAGGEGEGGEGCTVVEFN